jgi:probable HAF family extracellular repeat protein
MRDLGTLPGGSESGALGINDAGQVVGEADTPTVVGTFEHAFLWQDGVMQDLGTLPGGRVSQAFGINDAGQVVGYSLATGGGGPFLWSSGVMQDLNGTPGVSGGWANGVNDAGQVVGGRTAFLWQDGVMSDLNTLIDASTPGWVLLDARAINASGQIVGNGTYAGSANQHAFLATPVPEPGSLVGLGMILSLGLARSQRRPHTR